jgi:quinol monooxygenase YgiN
MYGLIGRIDAVPGKRDALMDILLEGTAGMPGCLLYVVSRDVDAPDALWVTEIWARKEDHQASLTLPAVRDAIGRGRPLIAGFAQRVELDPVGGHGLPGPTTG